MIHSSKIVPWLGKRIWDTGSVREWISYYIMLGSAQPWNDAVQVVLWTVVYLQASL